MTLQLRKRTGSSQGLLLATFALLHLVPALGFRKHIKLEFEEKGNGATLPTVPTKGNGATLPTVPAKGEGIKNLISEQGTSYKGSGTQPASQVDRRTSNRAFAHSVATVGALIIAVIFFIRSGRPTTIFIRAEEEHKMSVADVDIGGDAGDVSTQKLRSLACLVCCWAMCHLSIPSLLLLGNSDKLHLYANASSPIGTTMSMADFLLIAITAVSGGVVHDRWGHSAAVLYGVVIISSLCIAVEHLSFHSNYGIDDEKVASTAIGFLIPVIMGAMLTWHVSAMIMAFSLFARAYMAPLSLLLAAGVIEGSSHLDRLLDDEHIQAGGAQANASFCGLLALKFASVGLLACLQSSVFSSDAQRGPRRILPGKQFARVALQQLNSPKFFFLVFGQVVLVGLAGGSDRLAFGRGQLAAAPWEALATLVNAAAWGALLPACVHISSPEFCWGFLVALCMVFVGTIGCMDTHFISQGLCAWSMQRFCAAFILFGMAMFLLLSGILEERFKEENGVEIH